jgi:DNA-binding NarL/FixJ family response regulator
MVHHGRVSVPRTVGILLIDDQWVVRQGLRMLFQLEPGATVIGEAATALDGLSLAAALGPHVVVMDVEMPGMDGITATSLLMDKQPRCMVIVLTIHNDPVTRARALAAGAWAFVEKERPAELQVALRRAIDSIDTVTQ